MFPRRKTFKTLCNDETASRVQQHEAFSDLSAHVYSKNKYTQVSLFAPRRQYNRSRRLLYVSKTTTANSTRGYSISSTHYCDSYKMYNIACLYYRFLPFSTILIAFRWAPRENVSGVALEKKKSRLPSLFFPPLPAPKKQKKSNSRFKFFATTKIPRVRQ